MSDSKKRKKKLENDVGFANDSKTKKKKKIDDDSEGENLLMNSETNGSKKVVTFEFPDNMERYLEQMCMKFVFDITSQEAFAFILQCCNRKRNLNNHTLMTERDIELILSHGHEQAMGLLYFFKLDCPKKATVYKYFLAHRPRFDTDFVMKRDDFLKLKNWWKTHYRFKNPKQPF